MGTLHSGLMGNNLHIVSCQLFPDAPLQNQIAGRPQKGAIMKSALLSGYHIHAVLKHHPSFTLFYLGLEQFFRPGKKTGIRGDRFKICPLLGFCPLGFKELAHGLGHLKGDMGPHAKPHQLLVIHPGAGPGHHLPGFGVIDF